MSSRVRGFFESAYERSLKGDLSDPPSHVAVIQDGNRRYAREHDREETDGHRLGAETTEAMLGWCDELGIDELTLYTFSTENFERPADERQALFDLIETKLRDLADSDRVHESGLRIRVIGQTERLPERVREAIEYANRRTRSYDSMTLNVALAYGGRAELLDAAREVVDAVRSGDLERREIDTETIEARLTDGAANDVDLIVRTGGDERTSNFLPWHANGNEAAVAFCTPYWPAFRKIDFLRAIRTYESREASWQRTRARRALALLRAVGSTELEEARSVLARFRGRLPAEESTETLLADGDGTEQ